MLRKPQSQYGGQVDQYSSNAEAFGDNGKTYNVVGIPSWMLLLFAFFGATLLAILGLQIATVVIGSSTRSDLEEDFELISGTAELPDGVPTGDWINWGRDYKNDRYAIDEDDISIANVASLTLKCAKALTSGASATPTIQDDIMYVPDWSGTLWALDRFTCATIWSVDIGAIIAAANLAIPTTLLAVVSAVSRTSPAIDGDYIYVGTQRGALLIALDRWDGTVIWTKRVHSHPLAIITASPVTFGDNVYVGTASQEELATGTVSGYACCTFIGTFGAYSKVDGTQVWQIQTMPDNANTTGAYSGGAIWGSATPIDPDRRHIYVATGNEYSNPPRVEVCRSAYDASYNISNPAHNNVTNTTAFLRDPCRELGNHAESVLALDLDTGRLVWALALGSVDSYTTACGLNTLGFSITRNPSVCPQVPGPDADFGMAPILVDGSILTPNGLDVLVIGQKNGFLWAISPETGQLIWSTAATVGGVAGGFEFGCASDGAYLYCASANTNFANHTLFGGASWTLAGSWMAVRVLDGTIVWETANPANATAYGPVSVANGVVYAASLDAVGHFYAMDAATGTVLLDYITGSASAGGAAIVDGLVYITSGFHVDGKVSVLSL